MTTPITNTGKTRLDDSGLRDDFDALKADLAQLRNDIRGMSGHAVDAARTGVGAAKERVQHAAHAAADIAKDNVKSFEKKIEDHPLQSVAIALGVGVLIGSLLRR